MTPPREPSLSVDETACTRCAWASGSNSLMAEYHDKEWGVPVHDDRLLFEFIVLEGAQAGLSWNTILQRRENYRNVFVNFEPEKVARFTEKQIEAALANPGIIRNRLKVLSTVTNARAFIQIAEEHGSFDSYIWQFTGGQPIVNRWEHKSDVPAVTTEAETMAKDLKRRGFKFMGPTICYAHMQATGMVNDHTTDCFRWRQVSAGSDS